MWIRVALACFVLVLELSPAFAQSHDDAPSDDAQQQAAALIDEGVELRKAGNEREALAKFRDAYALRATPRVLAQMALAEKSIRNYVDAERHLEQALSDQDDPWISKNREALETARAYVAKQLAWLVVTSNVAEAELSVNGTVVGKLPLAAPHRVVAGLTMVVLRDSGHADKRTEVALVADEVTEIRVELEKLASTAPTTPPTAPPLSPDTPPPDEPASFTPWIVTSAVVSAVGLGIGIGLGVHTLNLKAARDDICPDPICTTQDGIDLDGEARAAATGSTVSFAIAGAAAVATLVLWLVEPDDSASTAVSIDGSGVSFRF